MTEPSYFKLHESGELQKRAKQLLAIYNSCTLCARNCEVNRYEMEKGICSGGVKARISSVHPHFGEERPLVGRYGSGTIFFTHCNLLCLYCQNWDISHGGEGYEINDRQLAAEMIRLQGMGCHNINLVTPSHYLPNIVQALVYAVEKGLNVPIVYNTGTYDKVEILKLLDGIVDIYLPDFKYADKETANKFSPGAADYPEIAKAALKEMHRQVGVLETDENGIAVRGLMIRHLVLPGNLAGTEEFVKFVATELNPGTYVNIMAQYHPAHRACNFQELSRRITTAEYQQALVTANELGLYNLD
jgi:putative pyruvate formate lyase activating enzyme